MERPATASAFSGRSGVRGFQRKTRSALPGARQIAGARNVAGLGQTDKGNPNFKRGRHLYRHIKIRRPGEKSDSRTQRCKVPDQPIVGLRRKGDGIGPDITKALACDIWDGPPAV